jgi:hypothetical protein
MSSDELFYKKARLAIQQGDYEALEGLRDEIRPAHVPQLVKDWNSSLPWSVKDAYATLLMDQTGKVIEPLMRDALQSPTPETRAYALCCLIGDFKVFESLLTSSSVDAKKVDAAIERYAYKLR